MSQQAAKAMRTRLTLLQTAAMREQPRPFESTRLTDQSRFEDHPAPTEDDMISKALSSSLRIFSIRFPNYVFSHYRGSLLKASPTVRVP